VVEVGNRLAPLLELAALAAEEMATQVVSQGQAELQTPAVVEVGVAPMRVPLETAVQAALVSSSLVTLALNVAQAVQ
jgi:hypothetical protein